MKIFTGVGATYPSGVELITVAGAIVNVTKTSSSASNLPSTSFVNLIANIKAVTGTDVSTSWVGASGSGNVAAAINNNSANSGRIGYLSNDFTKAYSASSTAPLSASIQARTSARQRRQPSRRFRHPRFGAELHRADARKCGYCVGANRGAYGRHYLQCLECLQPSLPCWDA